MTRRDLLKTAALAAPALPAAVPVPSYLRGYQSLYRSNPHAAALQWFQAARYGLFMHYTLASLFRRGKEDVQGRHIDWKQVQKKFTADKFDADFITGLAREAGMRYVNLTTRHIGDMCLFRTAQSDFTSLNSPARRDLVGEMADACRNKGLGFFLYCPPDVARTDPPHLARNHAQLRELLTQYGPVAGIWLDGIAYYYRNPELYTRLGETFALIRSLQPQCLISFKNGATGDEDFLAPEHFLHPAKGTPPELWEKLRRKPVEECTTMQTNPKAWINDEDATHMTAAEVVANVKQRLDLHHNLLLNTGLRGDGSVHPLDVRALRESGPQVRKLPGLRPLASIG
jgi:alpha-L-fucosidase